MTTEHKPHSERNQKPDSEWVRRTVESWKDARPDSLKRAVAEYVENLEEQVRTYENAIASWSKRDLRHMEARAASALADWLEYMTVEGKAAGTLYQYTRQTRHTYGHWLGEQHFDLEERQKAMGHESSKTTERYYGRVTDEDVARKIAELA